MSDCCYKGHQDFEYFATYTMFGCNSEARCRAYKAIVGICLCSLVSAYCEGCELVGRDELQGGLVVVTGTQPRVLGLFPMMCATRCCIYLPCVPGMTIYQFVLFRTFVILVPFLFKTIVYTTLCLHVAIPFLLYPYHQCQTIFLLCACLFCLEPGSH